MRSPTHRPEPRQGRAAALQREQNLRYLNGLRFEGRWEYLLNMPSGRNRWSLLPTGHDHPAPRDPHGLWWCIRRCVAVLLQQTWSASPLPLQLPPNPGARELLEILDVLLPGWKMLRHIHAGSTPLRCAQAVERGGSALMKLEFDGNGEPEPRVAWAWVVGSAWPPQSAFQTPLPSPPAERPAPPGAPATARLLVVLPPGWTRPMPGHYAARIAVDALGNCSLEHVDGSRSACNWLGTVVLKRSSGSGTEPAT